MADRTKIDLAGNIAIPVELRLKYGLRPNVVADMTSREEGLFIWNTAMLEDSGGATNGQPAPTPVPEPVKKWPHESVEYHSDTDTLILDDGRIIEQAAQKLRPTLYPMLAYLNELDEEAAVNSPRLVLEDIVRISSAGQIKVSRDFRYRYGLHPNAEVEITDSGDGLLIRKVADSENPADRAYGSAPPGGIVDQLGGTDAYVRWIRGR